MTFAFRADSSLRIGSGHIMRCLALADELKARGNMCHFICRTHEGNINQLVRDRGHLLHELPCKLRSKYNEVNAPVHIEWLGESRSGDAKACIELLKNISPNVIIVDHYALDAVWERLIRQSCEMLVVIDDLADRDHLCDLLIDQNLGRVPEDYAHLIPENCKVLCGPAYALLRPEFPKNRLSSVERRQAGQLRTVTISMGGVDAPDATSKVLRALRKTALPKQVEIKVLMGATAPAIANVRAEAAGLPWKTDVFVGINNVGEILADSDLVIGAAGGSAWERCALGVPTIIVILAENQRAGAMALIEHGAALLVGEVAEIESKVPGAVNSLLECDKLLGISRAAARLTDGKGVERVLDEITAGDAKGEVGRIRLMVEHDLALVLQWRNHPDIRNFMYSQREISWDDHVAWFTRCSADTSRQLLIYEEQGEPKGFVSFIIKSGGVADWGFYLAPGSSKGMGRKLGQASLTYGFNHLMLHKICGEVLAFNKSSLRFHERLGFIQEGVRRQHHFTGTDYIDVVLFGLLVQDWKTLKEKLV